MKERPVLFNTDMVKALPHEMQAANIIATARRDLFAIDQETMLPIDGGFFSRKVK